MKKKLEAYAHALRLLEALEEIDDKEFARKLLKCVSKKEYDAICYLYETLMETYAYENLLE